VNVHNEGIVRFVRSTHAFDDASNHNVAAQFRHRVNMYIQDLSNGTCEEESKFASAPCLAAFASWKLCQNHLLQPRVCWCFCCLCQ